jgi:hypothetical protein
MARSHHPREDQMSLFGADPHDIVREAWEPHPNVKPAELRKAHKEQDAAWLKQALLQLESVTRAQKEITVDDCWAHITMPPHTPRR